MTSPRVVDKQYGHIVHLSGGEAVIAKPLLSDWRMRWVHFYGASKSAALLEQKLSDCGIFSQADRSVVCVLGFTAFAKKLKEMSANGLIAPRPRSTNSGSRHIKAATAVPQLITRPWEVEKAFVASLHEM